MPCLKVSERHLKACSKVFMATDFAKASTYIYLSSYYLCCNTNLVKAWSSAPTTAVTASPLMAKSMSIATASLVLANRVLFPDEAILLVGGKRNKAGLAYAMHRKHPIHSHIRNSYRFRLDR